VNTKQKPNQNFGWVAQMVLPIFARQDNSGKDIKISLFFGRRNASPTRNFYVFPMDGKQQTPLGMTIKKRKAKRPPLNFF